MAGDEQTHLTIPGAGSTFLDDLQAFLRREDAERFVEMFTPFVVSGGLHGTVAGLTASPSALTAYPGGYYTTEDAPITYPNDTSFCWVIAHKDTSGNLGAFIRTTGTHYLVAVAGAQPALPDDGLWLMRVTTAAGAVTAVTDLRTLSPVPTPVLAAAIFLDGEGDPAALGMAAVDGVSVFAARRDHRHQGFADSEGDPADVGLAAADGVSGFAARRDHAHRSLGVLPVALTNRTGVALAAGDVVAIDTANNLSVVLGDTVRTLKPLVAALGAVPDTAEGRFAAAGRVTLKTQGAVTRGHYLRKSATTLAVEDAGVALGDAVEPPVAAVGVALSNAAGPGAGTVEALWLGRPTAGRFGCRVRKSAVQSVNHATWTAITWDTEDYDPLALHDPGVNPSRITVPIAGRYLVTANGGWATSLVGDRQLCLAINGVHTVATAAADLVGLGRQVVAGILKCAASDYLEVLAYQSTGGALNFDPAATDIVAHLAVDYLGPAV